MSNIEWCTKTWPLMYGCARVSDGCTHCYAEQRWVPRFQANPGLKELYNSGIVDSNRNWTGKVVMLDRNLDWPLRIKKPERIFVNPFSDLFHEAVPDQFIDQVFWRMAWCKQHLFMILTKRPLRMKVYCNGMDKLDRKERAIRILVSGGVKHFPEAIHNSGLDWPIANVALGVSVENQAMADQRIPHLLRTPATTRFISYEPALGPVDFSEYLKPEKTCDGHGAWLCEDDCYKSPLDQIIVGAESGKGARPMEVDWVRSIVAQCREVGVAVFVKQFCIDGHKIPFSEFPEDLKIRQIPGGMEV